MVTARPHNARALLLALGMHNFNITGVIPFLFFPASVTDSDSPDMMLLVAAIQNNLNAMGSRLSITGHMDVPTATALRQLTGRDWPAMHWHDIVTSVVNAKERGFRFAPRVSRPAAGTEINMSGFDMPGGKIGWGVLGVAAVLLFTRKKRSS